MGQFAFYAGIGSIAVWIVNILIGGIPLLSLCCFLTWPLGWLLALGAIVLGIIALVQNGPDKKKGVIGLVLGVISMVVMPIIALVVSLVIAIIFSGIL